MTTTSTMGTESVPLSPQRSRRSRRLPSRPDLRIIRSVAAFIVAFGVVAAARKAGFPTGYWVLGLAALALAFLPTTPLLSRRILFNGLIAAGLIPLLWWIPETVLGSDHGTFVLAAAAGLIVAWVSYGRRPAGRIRRLLPVVRWIDLLPFLAGLLSALSMNTFLAIRTPGAALSIMTTRWDFQSHFSIYNMLRTHGSVIPMVPDPSTGGIWGFSEYPQGFHTILATLAEIISPKAKGLDAELVSYINLQAVLCGLTVVLITAGLCSLPNIRRRAALLSPAIAVAVAAWTLGPGSIPVFEGFANFYLGCGLAAATILTLLAFGRKIPVVGVAAVGAGIVGVGNNWILLASLFAAVVLLTFGRTFRDRRLFSIRWWISTALIIAITFVGVLLPILQMLPLLGRAQGILEAPGGMALPEFGWALAIISVVIALGFANLAAPADTRLQGVVRRRTGLASIGILLPVLVCIWLAYTQINGSGSISYYFYKYLVAVELVAWVLAVAALATLVARSHAEAPKRRSLALGAALGVSSLAVTQVFGFSVVGLSEIGLPPTAFPMLESSRQAQHILQISPTVDRLLASGHLGQSRDSVYVASGSDIDMQLAFRWQLGMSGNLTSNHIDLEAQLVGIGLDKPASSQIITKVLSAHPGLHIIVNPELYSQVHGTLGNPEVEGRLQNIG